ncbi:hypothetical protein [Subtercola boreus]|uniref:Uncharacterized protein n=1 Tax=Subtercola boreus TaxID=120213 RepID=A0A3E0WCY2_9MICO|nr:hypothetical protein [Subtercola boreus]RFA20810.1 hypothetical protein B7R24_08580 [Subtercola boreus]RFA20925.1 hypothetical protein B7R23_08520 [Subtercola boreus]RFA27118.1 hypothetical protein B7R25_08645 [Subtercola boreus]
MSGEAGSRSGVPLLVSPVLTLLGGAVPEGMVCGVDGVCAPVGAGEGVTDGTAPASRGDTVYQTADNSSTDDEN